MSSVNLKDIRKSYGKVPILHGVSIDIEAGAFISLLGASGCGKTTLLRIIAGLEDVASGSVHIDRLDVTALPPEKRDISMMFQSYALLPHLSVYENVRFPLRMRRIGCRDEQEERVKVALESVQLGHLATRKPHQLSGGQMQRVALARAIVSNPKVLLLDEPLSNLDARLREDMQVELIELHRRLGLTTVFVTHDQEEALSLSDQVVLLNGGRIEQQGRPAEIYANPGTRHASSFLGAANLLDVTVTTEAGKTRVMLADGQSLTLQEGEPQAGHGTLAIRQEDMTIAASPTPGALRATVLTRVFLGARYRYVLELAGKQVRVLTDTNVVLSRGAAVWIAIPAGKLRLLAG